MFEKINVWYIECETGCSCCSYQNFNQGFYKTEDEPRQIIQKWLKGENNPLGSQYAKYGIYTIIKTDAELLPDGRIIVDDRVYAKDYIGDFYD